MSFDFLRMNYFSNNLRYGIYLISMFFYSITADGQNTISLTSAIQAALTNNLQLQVYRNDAKIAHNNNYAGNAGMRPNIYFNANDNPSLTNINQKYANGTSIEKNGVVNNSVNANILATINLFDGNKMFATKRKLEILDIAGNNLLKSQIQAIVTQVINSYSNIIRQQNFLEVVTQLEELSEQRLAIIKARQMAGLANNTDLYLAELDIETNKQSIIVQNVLIKNAYIDLNMLMNIKVDSSYVIEAFNLSSDTLKRSELDSMLKQNPDLLLSKNQLEIAEQTQKEVAAARLPLVRLSGAYNYNLSQSQAGFALLNQSYGPQAGIGLTVPIFTGSVNARNYKNAQLNTEKSRWQQQLALLNIQGAYEQSWATYAAAQAQLKSDAFAIETAQKYIDLMQERFKAGQNTIIELKEAQRSYEVTYYRFISNQYIAKLAETQLLGLTGQLTN